jgi:hypothetical protein
VSLPPGVVEPLIALSIAYVAIENVITRQLHAWRVLVVFLFGLAHGMGWWTLPTHLEVLAHPLVAEWVAAAEAEAREIGWEACAAWP